MLCDSGRHCFQHFSVQVAACQAFSVESTGGAWQQEGALLRFPAVA